MRKIPQLRHDLKKIPLAVNLGYNFRPGHEPFNGGNPDWAAGKEQVFTKDQWDRKFDGLRKAWNVKAKLNAGKRVKTLKDKQKAKNEEWLTVAKEAREIQNRAREYAWSSMEELAEIIKDPNTPKAVKVSAIALMHERAYGKPNQVNVNANVSNTGKPNELGTDELDTRIATTLKRVEQLTERASQEAASPPQSSDVRKLH
jgi:hypothetical protein